MMSAGSHTEPGGYTGQGREKVHRTVRGRIMPPEIAARRDALPRVQDSPGRVPSIETPNDIATSQFEIGDPRSPQEIAALLRRDGVEPVWKDWDAALMER
jgi:2-iminoacetate synthase